MENMISDCMVIILNQHKRKNHSHPPFNAHAVVDSYPKNGNLFFILKVFKRCKIEIIFNYKVTFLMIHILYEW